MNKWSKYSYLLAGILLLISGMMHIIGIFYDEDLNPNDPEFILLMRNMPVKMDSSGTMWDFWVGFHAMYGMCLVFMGTMLAFLSIKDLRLLLTQHFIPLLFIGTIGFFIWIGINYLIMPFSVTMAIIFALLFIGFFTGSIKGTPLNQNN